MRIARAVHIGIGVVAVNRNFLCALSIFDTDMFNRAVFQIDGV